MSAFDIPPHSRRTNELAMGVLALVAMAAFTQGFLGQLASDTPAPPPRPNAAYANIAEATPAPTPTPALQVAERPKTRKAAIPDITDDLAPAADAADAGAVPAPVAADAAAIAPEAPAPAPPPPPAPEEAPS